MNNLVNVQELHAAVNDAKAEYSAEVSDHGSVYDDARAGTEMILNGLRQRIRQAWNIEHDEPIDEDQCFRLAYCLMLSELSDFVG